MGCALGKYWAMWDATSEQLLRVKEFGDGWEWVALHREPAKEFTGIVDPDKCGFMGVDGKPPASFIAGFIHGAQTIETSIQAGTITHSANYHRDVFL